MKFLTIIPITVAVIAVLATDASSATKVTTLGATRDRLVLRVHWGNENAADAISCALRPSECRLPVFQEVEKVAAKHCKKYQKLVGDKTLSLNSCSPSGLAAILCVSKNQAVNSEITNPFSHVEVGFCTESAKKAPQKKGKRSRLLKSWE